MPRKLFIVFLFILLSLPVSANTENFMDKALNSWVGYNINDIINSWGFPVEEKIIANRHIYIWNKAWSQHVPQRTHCNVTPYYYNSSVTTYTTGGYTVNYYCNKTIEVDSKNNIISLYWEGNACPSKYKHGKKLVNPNNDEWEKERLRKLKEKQEKKLKKQRLKQEKRLKKEQLKKEKKNK